MSTYGRSDRRDRSRDSRDSRDYDEYGRDRDRRDRDRSYDRDYDRDSRSRYRDRSSDRGSRERNGERSYSDRRDKSPLAQRDRQSKRTLSSPSHTSRKQSSNSAAAAASSSGPSSPKSTQSSQLGQLTEAYQRISKRLHEHVVIKLRKDALEARAKEREVGRKQLEPKYNEFPALRDSNRKIEKRDLEDLAVLRKDSEAAGKKTLAATEAFMAIVLQAIAEQGNGRGTDDVGSRLDSQLEALEKRLKGDIHDNSKKATSLETRLNSRFELLEKKLREDASKQGERVDQLQQGLATEMVQRKALAMENESLRNRLLKLEKNGVENESLKTKPLELEKNSAKAENEALGSRLVDLEKNAQLLKSQMMEHAESLKSLSNKEPAATAAVTTDVNLQAQHAADILQLQQKLAGHDSTNGHIALDQLADVQAQHAAGIVELSKFVEAHSQALGDLAEIDRDLVSETCEEVGKKLPRLEQITTKLDNDMATLRTDATQLRTDIQQLESKMMETLEGRICKFDTGMSDLESRTDKTERESGDLRLAHDQLKNDLLEKLHTTKLDNDIAALQTDTIQLRTNIQQLESKTIEALEGRICKLDTGMSDIQSRTDKVERESEDLRLAHEQLKNDLPEKRQTSTEQPHPEPGAEQVTSSLAELQSAVDKVRSDVQELQSTVQGKPSGKDAFITMSNFQKLNVKLLSKVADWVEALRSDLKVVKGEVADLQKRPIPDKSSTPITDGKGSPSETKWEEYDVRIKALEEATEPLFHERPWGGSPLQELTSFVGTTRPTVDKMKSQILMIEASLKSITESIKHMSENQDTENGRIAEVEQQMATNTTRLEQFEPNLKTIEQKIEKRMDLVQQDYMALDGQMNNLTTESLFHAIIQHLDKYQPSGAQLGQKVETIIQQMNQHEHRLVKVERSSSLSSDEPASKKRKFSPPGYGSAALTNGNH